MSEKSKWAIRDIGHGKTFFCSSYHEMVAWVIKGERKKQNEIVNLIINKDYNIKSIN